MENIVQLIQHRFDENTRVPDDSQLAAITKTDNTVVSAGAGSGKTEVLAIRFAYLLMENPSLKVKNILALTFTKKAATEIYARVHKKLKFYGEHGNEASKKALEDFSDARVQTLDSYSSDIVRLAANLYGIRPDFSVGASGCERDVYNAALPFVLKNKEAHKECFAFFSRAGAFEQFAKDYFVKPVLDYTTIATEAGWFSRNLALQAARVFDIWNSCRKRLSDALGMIQTLYEENAAQKKGTPFFKALEAVAEIDVSRIPSLDDSDRFLSDRDFRSRMRSEAETFTKCLAPIAQVKLNAKGYVREINAVIKEIRGDDEHPDSLLKRIGNAEQFLSHFDLFEEMYALMDEFLAIVNRNKKLSGNLSFKDINDLALRILVEQKDIRRQQKSTIRKIMIDEFQDNNESNRNLLYLIAEKDGTELDRGDFSRDADFWQAVAQNLSPDKLFFVGDEKQSIYKFRGADVSVFNGLKKTLQDSSGIPDHAQLSMTNNYRSHPDLLRSFNLLFGTDDALTENDRASVSEAVKDEAMLDSLFHMDSPEKVPDYEALYLKTAGNFATKNDSDVDSVTLEAAEADSVHPVRIHACILNSGKDRDGAKTYAELKKAEVCLPEQDTTAFFIARRIHDMMKADPSLKYSDFAVLDMSRTHRNTLQRFLTLFEIPFVVDMQKNIFSEGIANDFANVLRLCIYPDDINAFAAFLRSPFAGLSGTAVQNIVSLLPEGYSVFDDLNLSGPLPLSPDDERKFSEAKSWFENARTQILSQSITQSVEKLWYDAGYCFETMLNSSLQLYAEQFDVLYELARQAENSGNNVAWFVDQLSLIKEKENAGFMADSDAELDEESLDYPLEKPDAVTIMTIHQSKGLEFNHVFVTGIFGNVSSARITPAFFDGETVSLKGIESDGNLFHELQKEEDKKRELAEQKRKIYVAITRARESVFLVGDLERKTKESPDDPIMRRILRRYYALDKDQEPLFSDNIFPDSDRKDDWDKETYDCCSSPFFNPEAAFDLIRIYPVPAVFRNAKTRPQNQLKKELISAAAGSFAGKAPESYPQFTDCTSSPSKLESCQRDHSDPLDQCGSGTGFDIHEAYSEINSIVSSTAAADEKAPEESAAKLMFTFGDFGTMAHSFLEYAVKYGPVKAENPENVENSECFDPRVGKLLSENFSGDRAFMHQKLSGICSSMARQFFSSPIGQRVADAKKSGRLVKAENEFRLNIENVFFSGFVDLFFEAEDSSLVIVDYKTDGTDSAGLLHPERYYLQQACYRFALSQLYGVPEDRISTWLYFLRYDLSLDITEHTKIPEKELADFARKENRNKKD